MKTTQYDMHNISISFLWSVFVLTAPNVIFANYINIDFIKNWHKFFALKAHSGKKKLWPTYPSFAVMFLLTIFEIQFLYWELNKSKRIQSQNSSAMYLQLAKDRLVWKILRISFFSFINGNYANTFISLNTHDVYVIMATWFCHFFKGKLIYLILNTI